MQNVLPLIYKYSGCLGGLFLWRNMKKIDAALPHSLAALDLLASGVLVLDDKARIHYANAAAQDLFKTSLKSFTNQKLTDFFVNGQELHQLFLQAQEYEFADKRQDLVLERAGHEPILVHSIITVLDNPALPVLIELRENVQQIKQDREERMLENSQANKELIRNLAHEIKNPLGGIRGAAQLLELELPERDAKELREYTQVIIKEADRLQTLVDRLLAPHRLPHIVSEVNIHEVCERVRSLIVAEFPRGMRIERDYDLSIPDFRGDFEQLIQSVLNIAHNAAQALSERIENGDAVLTFKTRIVRQITIAKIRYRLALDLHIIDNGPGIAPEMLDKIFFPLVSGRDGGSGLGLTLAQTFIGQHHGVIECQSKPGLTDFRILIPLP